MCVWQTGMVDDKQNPGEYLPWWKMSCWVPRFRLEDFKLDSSTYQVWAVLTTEKGDKPTEWVTPHIQVKPEPTPTNGEEFISEN